MKKSITRTLPRGKNQRLFAASKRSRPQSRKLGNRAVAVALLTLQCAWATAQSVPAGAANGPNSTAIGTGSTANGNDSIAAGRNSTAVGIDSIAIGHNASNAANAQYGVSIGSGASTSDFEGVAIGHVTSAAFGSVAIGRQSKALFASSVSLGDSTQTLGVNAVAIGSYAEARLGSISLGDNTGRFGNVKNANNVGIGSNAALFVNGSENAALGTGAGGQVAGTGNSAFGSGAGTWVTGNANVAIGYNAGSGDSANPVAAFSTVAIGSSALASESAGIAIGTGARSQAQGATSIGWGATAAGTGSIVAGSRTARDNAAIANAIPASSSAAATNAVVLGGAYNAAAPGSAVGATASGINGVAIGAGTNSSGAGTVTGAQASGANAIALGGSDQPGGYGARAQADDTVAIGRASLVNASAARGVALGFNASVASVDDVAIGSNSQTTAVTAMPATTLLGRNYNFAGATPVAAFAVGNRQVQGVAAGRISGASTDAVNGSQLYATNQALSSLSTNLVNGTAGLVQQTGGSPGSGDITVGTSTSGSRVDFAGQAGNRQLSGIADGVARNDGATVGQLGGITSALGGGSRINPDGSVSAPSYTLRTVNAAGVAGSNTYANVGDALGSLSNSVGNLNTLASGIAAGGGIKYFRANSSAADSSAAGSNSVAVGGNALASGDGAMAQGASSLATGTNAMALGNGAMASNAGSIAVGLNASSTGTNSVAVGTNAVAANSVAVGANAHADRGGVALGDNATARSSAQGTAVGNGAIVQSQSARGVALGAGSIADRAAVTGQKELFSGVATTSGNAAVSVGFGGGERQITNVIGGTQATDAVNVRQLQAVQAASVQYARRTDGSTDVTKVALGDGTTPTTVSNVAAGTAPTDAVNVQQLNAELQATQQLNENRAVQLQQQLAANRRQASAGTASAMALSGLPQPTAPGKNMVAAAVGSYDGEGAMAMGIARVDNEGKWVLKAGGTLNSRGKIGAAVGAGYQW